MPPFSEDVCRAQAALVEKYEREFYRVLRKLMAQHQSDSEAFPDWLKGAKRLVIYVGTDGIIVLHFDALEDSAVVQAEARSITQIVQDHIHPDRRAVFTWPAMFELADASSLDREGHEVWRSPWRRMEVVSGFDPELWTEQMGKDNAIQLVFDCMAAHLQGVKSSRQTPAQTRQVVVDRLDSAIQGLVDLLDMEPLEGVIHRYLNDHPVLLHPTAVSVKSEVPMGAEYEMDFVVELPERRYILVEIEQSKHRLFNKKGDASGELTHAIGQAENWRDWATENIAYARTKLPGIIDPECWIIIGRRRNLTDRNKRALARKNNEYHHIRILTYDDLLDTAHQYLSSLQRLVDSADADSQTDPNPTTTGVYERLKFSRHQRD